MVTTIQKSNYWLLKASSHQCSDPGAQKETAREAPEGYHNTQAVNTTSIITLVLVGIIKKSLKSIEMIESLLMPII